MLGGGCTRQVKGLLDVWVAGWAVVGGGGGGSGAQWFMLDRDGCGRGDGS